MGQEGDALRAAAQKERQEAQASFERCDTDGFLSQWASGIEASRLDLAAKIADNGGRAKFTGLYEGERRVVARLVAGQFGDSWLLYRHEQEKFGRRFIPCGSTSRVQKKLGLTERLEWAPAEAYIAGSGHGLSGRAWAAVKRTGDPWGQDALLIERCEEVGSSL